MDLQCCYIRQNGSQKLLTSTSGWTRWAVARAVKTALLEVVTNTKGNRVHYMHTRADR
jgi:hypothetical protein